MAADLDIRLPSSPAAPALARRAVDDLTDDLPTAVTDDLRLLVSELVTNSVRHAGTGDGCVRLQVTRSPRHIRVEVADCGKGFAAPAEPVPRDSGTGGFGLYLVRLTAARWGVVRDRLTRVWFELELA
jgi:anti-sigma regulatory factor (Ser/Thr protein kinase)